LPVIITVEPNSPPPENLGIAVSRIYDRAPARQPELSSASRITVGSAAEGSTSANHEELKKRQAQIFLPIISAISGTITFSTPQKLYYRH
jgi:hypothetical protein